MNMKAQIAVVVAVIVAASVAWWTRETFQPGEPPGPHTVTARAEAPATTGDLVFAEITASWTFEQSETCARPLRDMLGTRDLVQSALDAVKDPAGKATAEIADARHWVALADSSFARVRPRLVAGDCAGEVGTALEQATLHLVNAGTSAVQAAQMVK